MIKQLSYIEVGLKNHLVCGADLAEVVMLDVKTKHQCDPTSSKEFDKVTIDPGGMLDMRSEYIVSDINGFKFQVKPEHIGDAIYVWSNSKRDIDPNSIKIYLGYVCICVDKDTYFKVGQWLTSLEATGLEAKMDIYNRLSGHPNIMMAPPKSLGES